MRKFLLFVCSLLIALSVQAQDTYLSRNSWIFGERVVDSIKNNYQNNIIRYLVYGASNDSSRFDAILFIETGKGVEYWIIYDENVIKTGRVDSNSIFRYPDYRKTGAVNSEKYSLRTLVPPIITGFDTEFVVYKDKSSDFYFEYGKNILSFKEDARRKKFRKEWLEIIRNQVRTIL